MTPPLARRERHELCDLALTVGEDAPTLCGDWIVKDLVVHLLVRENRPMERRRHHRPAGWPG